MSLASSNGHQPVGEFLVRAGAKIGDAGSSSFLQSILDLNQQLRDAAKEGDLEAVTRLVRDEGAYVNGADDEVLLVKHQF